MLGVVSFNAFSSKAQILQKDAKRIALLLQLAREEAIVRNRQVAFELDTDAYRFYIREGNIWKRLDDTDLFRERNFESSPITIMMQQNGKQITTLPMRIVFGREPTDKPFVLNLSYDKNTVSLYADGVGHFSVE